MGRLLESPRLRARRQAEAVGVGDRGHGRAPGLGWCPGGGRQQLVLTDGCRTGPAVLIDDKSERDAGTRGRCPLAQSTEMHLQSIERS